MRTKFYLNNQKLSPYECGFNPYKKARIPFSLRFFLIIIIFLVFDVEITLLLPLRLLVLKWNFIVTSKIIIVLISLMTLGFIHEWNQGSLNWLYYHRYEHIFNFDLNLWPSPV